MGESRSYATHHEAAELVPDTQCLLSHGLRLARHD